jgi:hypothetical protein
MDLNFPVFDTGVRIFRASNDVGPLFLGPGSTRIFLVYVWTQDPEIVIRTPVANAGKLRSIGQVPVVVLDRRLLSVKFSFNTELAFLLGQFSIKTIM